MHFAASACYFKSFTNQLYLHFGNSITVNNHVNITVSGTRASKHLGSYMVSIFFKNVQPHVYKGRQLGSGPDCSTQRLQWTPPVPHTTNLSVCTAMFKPSVSKYRDYYPAAN